MKRSHAIARMLGLSVCMMLASQLNAQRTFEEYFKLVKVGEMGQRQTNFMKECGVDAASSSSLYGVKLGAIDDERWSPRPLLGIGKEEAFIQFYTAEIRVVDEKPRVINTWWVTKDTGESQNAMYCLNDHGKIKTILTLNIYEPVEGVKATPNRYLRRQEFLSPGNGDHGGFVTAEDAPQPPPRLSSRDLKAAQAPARSQVAQEVLRDLWTVRRGPMVVPYEDEQPVTPKKR